MFDKKLTQKNWSSWHHQLHKEILTKKILIPKGSNILMSVSGGQDSMALLTLINDLKNYIIGLFVFGMVIISGTKNHHYMLLN